MIKYVRNEKFIDFYFKKSKIGFYNLERKTIYFYVGIKLKIAKKCIKGLKDYV